MTAPRMTFLDEAGFHHDPLRWAWALGAIYNLYHGFPVDLPIDPDIAERRYSTPLEAARTYLPRDWGIEDRAGLIAQMIQLGRAGHRRTHRSLVRRLCALPIQPWEHYEAADRERAEAGDEEARQRLWRMWAVGTDFMQCRSASLLAFDAARAVQLARNGYALGYLEEVEMRRYIFDVARQVGATFSSWEAFGHDFSVGRAFWAGGHDDGTWMPLIARLSTEADSPWTRLPFAFPEDDASGDITSAEVRDAPYWTLEAAPVHLAWPAQ